MKYSLKKKFIFICIALLIFFVLINILYDFFYGDDIDNLYDKLYFRFRYYSREILETTINYNDSNTNNVLSKDNISIKLSSIDYEKSSGLLKANFEIYTKDESFLDKLHFMLRIHNNTELFYNSSVGDMLFVGNTDYLLYNKNLYPKLSAKKFDISKLDEATRVDIVNTSNTNCKSIELNFNLGENYEIQDKLYIEFLDLIYKPLYKISHKVFDPLGEFRFIINIQ